MNSQGRQPLVGSFSMKPTNRTAASPRARRAMRQRGLNAGVVAGTGPGGRIVEADVLRAAAQPSSTRTQTAAAGTLSPMRRGRGRQSQRKLRHRSALLSPQRGRRDHPDGLAAVGRGNHREAVRSAARPDRFSAAGDGPGFARSPPGQPHLAERLDRALAQHRPRTGGAK